MKLKNIINGEIIIFPNKKEFDEYVKNATHYYSKYGKHKSRYSYVNDGFEVELVKINENEYKLERRK